MVYPKVQLV